MVDDGFSEPMNSSKRRYLQAHAHPQLRLAWAVFRLPIFLGVLIFFKDRILDLVDPAIFTLFVINVAGTPLSRIVFFAATVAMLLFFCRAARPLGPVRAYMAVLSVVMIAIPVAFHLTGTSIVLAVSVVALLATNLLPDSMYKRILSTARLRNGFMMAGVGIAEGLFFRQYLNWIAQPWSEKPILPESSFRSLIPSVLLAAGAASVFVSGAGLTRIEQALRMSDSAKILAVGDFNWIEFDMSRRHIYVTGHGVPKMLRLDVLDPVHGVLEAPEDTGSAQAFAYDPAANEIYVFNGRTNRLLYLNASTLAVQRSIAIPDLSPGDPWIAVDQATNTITVVSEADAETGVPFVVLDRATGKVLDRRDLDAGNVLLRADESRLYLSFFRRRGRLLAYDLRTLSIVGDVPAPSRVDRMAFLEPSNEVLLVSPAESRVERFDAATLASKGHISTIFGVRVVAVDASRGILFFGSLATGEVTVIDLETHRHLDRFYLGPWLRTILLDPARATAYVSSNGALYELRYDHVR